MEDLEIPAIGILYLLEEGYYLYRWKENDIWESKFLLSADVRAAFTKIEFSSGLLLPGTVLVGIDKDGPYYVYHSPPSIRQIYLDDYDGKVLELTVPVPATIQIVHNTQLHIFAYQNGEVTPKGRLYKMPFPNVDSYGTVCWGLNKPKGNHWAAREALDMFYGSPFSNHNTSEKVKAKDKPGFMSDCRELLIELNGKKKFPMKRLVMVGHLGKILKEAYGISIVSH